MHTFEVWAPGAHGVEAVTGGQRHTMVASTGGWWTVDVSDAGPGTDYLFSVDGGEPRPDPRSPWQPDGVDGPSRVVDHGAFAWTDDSWRGLHLPAAVLYELHVGTFSEAGTFDGVVEHLDHLVDLGVTGIELCPVAEFGGGRGWGYDGVDLWAPHHAYGGPEGLKRLVDACHARGLGVVLDVVYNHLGPAGNYLGTFGPYFTDAHATNWGDAVNVDGSDSGGVRDFLIGNAVGWMRDYHIDGLRLDAVHAIVDDSAVNLLEEMADAVAALAAQVGRPLFLIAESDLNDPRFVRSPDAGGYGLDAAWADEFHHALHAVLTGDTDGYYADFGELAQVATALERAWVFAGEYSPYRRRVHGRPPTGLAGSSFVVCLQNHDQIGNRAVGERIAQLCPPGRARIGAALTLLSPFVPMLFQGEEWAASSPFQYFTDHQDPELGRAVSEGRRAEFSTFGWSPEQVPDPQDPATFARSVLRWDEVDEPAHAGMLAWYRALLALRRSEPALGDGRRDRVSVEVDETAGWLVVHRGPIAVVANLGTEPLEHRASGAEILLASDDVALRNGGLRLPVDSVAVLRTPTGN